MGSSASSAATRRSRERRWPSGASTSRARSSTTARSTPASIKGNETRRSSRSTRRSAHIGPARSASTSCTRSRTSSCPGPGACGGQYTANTMSTVMEFIGLSPAGLNGIPAEDPAKDEAARKTGELVMDLVRRDVRPSRFVTRESLENGIASVAATGGSTNGVLHLLAIAHEFGIDARHRRVRGDRRPDADRRGHASGRPLPGRRHVRRGRHRTGHARTAQAPGPAARRRADRRRPDDRADRRGRQGDRRPEGRPPDRDPAQADRRAGDPARLAGPGWLRREAGRARAPAAPRAGPRVRLRGGLLRGRQATAASSPATSS